MGLEVYLRGEREREREGKGAAEGNSKTNLTKRGVIYDNVELVKRGMKERACVAGQGLQKERRGNRRD